ncbi:hypothetical protein KEM55_007440, partial [Ascosphaera atra]
KITADNKKYGGIHPLVALESHEQSLAKLIGKAINYLPPASSTVQSCGDSSAIIPTVNADACLTARRKPDFVSVTRGPGMRSNLAVGLDTAKGLAIAWQVPLVGVHHMQGHLLTPRLVSALNGSEDLAPHEITPDFPFMSILVSGGHTMLVNSRSLNDHEVLVDTVDIALGDAIDKIARLVLPPSLIETAEATMYGKSLEAFAFPNGVDDHHFYQPPVSRHEEIKKRTHEGYDWTFALPFVETKNLEFSFAGIPSRVKRILNERRKAAAIDSSEEQIMPLAERVALARTLMQVCFEHLASRILMALQELELRGEARPSTLVISGGVAANKFLWTVLRQFLDARGYPDIHMIAPPPKLCTDNAAMIGWAGIEMFESGLQSDLSCLALRKWSLDSQQARGGILGVDGWKFKTETQENDTNRSHLAYGTG